MQSRIRNYITEFFFYKSIFLPLNYKKKIWTLYYLQKEYIVTHDRHTVVCKKNELF